MTNPFERPMEINSVESLIEDMATVLTGKPLPPGSRISFTAAGATIHAKVVAIKKRGESQFAVNVRVHSLTKSDKDALLSVL
ncbi:MAG: hypothetical protein JXR76_00250 [Deltaproteobacteria bacterium]|nr:hypothetical protein [Deltaproteobacteria bacterium]